MQENLRIIEKNTGRLLDLSNQLLDFRKTESRGFKLNYVKTDVVLWLETILHPFRPAVRVLQCIADQVADDLRECFSVQTGLER